MDPSKENNEEIILSILIEISKVIIILSNKRYAASLKLFQMNRTTVDVLEILQGD